jgi:hypothetical protein
MAAAGYGCPSAGGTEWEGAFRLGGAIGWERALRRFHLPAMSLSSRRPNCCEPARITDPRVARKANMATLVPSRSARRIGLLVGGGKSGALTDADFRGCRWIEGEPKPLRRGMFCGRPVLAGESWCVLHRGIVFGNTPPIQEVGFSETQDTPEPGDGGQKSAPCSPVQLRR